MGVSFVKPDLRFEDFHYFWRMWQRYQSIDVLWMVVTVVAGEGVVENLNDPSNHKVLMLVVFQSIVWICIAV